MKEGLERQCAELCELQRVLCDKVLFREEDLYQTTLARLGTLLAGAQECTRAAAGVLKAFEQDLKKLADFEAEARQLDMSNLLLARARSLRSTTHKTSRDALGSIKAQAEKTYRALDPQNKADEEATLALFLGLDRLFFAVVDFYNARVKLWSFDLDKKVLRLQTPQQLITAYKAFEVEVIHRFSFQQHLSNTVAQENARWDNFVTTVAPSVPPPLRLRLSFPITVQSSRTETDAPAFRKEAVEQSPEDVLRDENNALRAQLESLKKALEDKEIQISDLREEIKAMSSTDN